ncbi:hypothetical protein [uncultured Ruminococcus sp.]|uniref:hypothetical protein n=1 Tax=uncultured Ruminococcus sp. TaxID=165186 RepID=UPI0025945E06|nr:hypothetical protein [uncultured Ruminococcus sp.]
MRNQDLRTYAKEKGVCLWQVAQALGISEPTMTRRMRRELSQQDKQAMRDIVDALAAKKGSMTA